MSGPSNPRLVSGGKIVWLMYVALVSEVERKVLVGAELEDAGYLISAIDVNDAAVVDSGIMVVELAAAEGMAIDDGAACLGRRSPCRRSSKSILLRPKSSVMKWTVSFQGDGDVCNVISCSPSSTETPDTLQKLENRSPRSSDAYRCGSRAPSLLQPSWEVMTKNSSTAVSS
jgi:hypothetical protein